MRPSRTAAKASPPPASRPAARSAVRVEIRVAASPSLRDASTAAASDAPAASGAAAPDSAAAAATASAPVHSGAAWQLRPAATSGESHLEGARAVRGAGARTPGKKRRPRLAERDDAEAVGDL